ncbi:MAG: hypothetical protein GXO93_09140 [FCB group bacterium]|nr:hypothetical protein [FCB group bacterium]
MFKTYKLFFILLSFIFGIAMSSQAGIVRVAKHLNMIEFYGGYARPVGTYHRIDIIDFLNSQNRIVDLDADKVYDKTFYVGFSYGQLMYNHILYSIGFRYTEIKAKDTFWVEPNYGWSFTPEKPKFNQYDLDFNLNYFINNPSHSLVSPYFGLGFHGGITAVTGYQIETTTDVTLALGVNFGADFTLWKAPDKRSLVTLSSVNEYQFVASDKRPKYLNLGMAIKYYFRP